MKFRIKLMDHTVIYVNNICIFNAGENNSLTTWKKDGPTWEIDRWIPLKDVFTVEVDDTLIYC